MAAQSPLDRGTVPLELKMPLQPLSFLLLFTLSPSTLHPGPLSPKRQLLKMDLRSPEKKPWVPGYPPFELNDPFHYSNTGMAITTSRNLCYLQFNTQMQMSFAESRGGRRQDVERVS